MLLYPFALDSKEVLLSIMFLFLSCLVDGEVLLPIVLLFPSSVLFKASYESINVESKQ